MHNEDYSRLGRMIQIKRGTRSIWELHIDVWMQEGKKCWQGSLIWTPIKSTMWQLPRHDEEWGEWDEDAQQPGVIIQTSHVNINCFLQERWQAEREEQ